MLADLQREFAGQVLRGDPAAGIYSKTVLGSLIGALEDTFAACRETVGDEFFAAMAGRYVRATPAHSPSLNDWGESLPEFIAHFGPAQELPYLSDLARLEWARHRAGIARDSFGLDPARLAAVAERDRDTIVLEPAPGLALVESDHPIHEIFELAENPSLPAVDLDAGGVRLVVYRDGPATVHTTASPAQAGLVRMLLDGATFGVLVDRLEAEDVPALLAQALRSGWITGLAS